jgi:hypothetical protein
MGVGILQNRYDFESLVGQCKTSRGPVEKNVIFRQDPSIHLSDVRPHFLDCSHGGILVAAYCVNGVKKPVPFIGGCVLCMCTPEYYTGNFLPFSRSPPELLGGIRYVVKVCFSAL